MISIQTGAEKDIPEIGKLLIDTWQQCYRDFLPESFLDGMDAKRQVMRHTQYFEKGVPYFLAKNTQGELVGFASYSTYRNRDFQQDVELYTLYVSKVHQGQGIGKRLLDHVLHDCQGKSDWIWVTVMAANPYLPFYLNNGFNVVSEEELDFGEFLKKGFNLRRPVR